MTKVYNNINFDEQPLECPKCNWKGAGEDAIIIDLYGVVDTSEIHCPECDAYIAGLRVEE